MKPSYIIIISQLEKELYSLKKEIIKRRFLIRIKLEEYKKLKEEKSSYNKIKRLIKRDNIYNQNENLIIMINRMDMNIGQIITRLKNNLEIWASYQRKDKILIKEYFKLIKGVKYANHNNKKEN